MRSITLSWSVLKAHSTPPSSPKPSKPLTTQFFSSNSLSMKHTSKLSLRNPTLVFSRDLRRGCENKIERWFGRFLHTAFEYRDDLEIRYTDSRNCKATRDSIDNVDDASVSDDFHTKYSSRREYQLTVDNFSYDLSFGGIMKFMLFFGLLTLQRSQTAVAGTGFGSGLQSIPYLGDLGDISTGILAHLLFRIGGQDFFHCGTFSC